MRTITVVLLALASIASAEVLPVAEGPMELKAMSDWNRTQFLAKAAEASGRECYSPIRSRSMGEDKQKNPLWGLECASRKKPLPQFLIVGKRVTVTTEYVKRFKNLPIDAQVVRQGATLWEYRAMPCSMTKTLGLPDCFSASR